MSLSKRYELHARNSVWEGIIRSLGMRFNPTEISTVDSNKPSRCALRVRLPNRLHKILTTLFVLLAEPPSSHIPSHTCKPPWPRHAARILPRGGANHSLDPENHRMMLEVPADIQAAIAQGSSALLGGLCFRLWFGQTIGRRRRSSLTGSSRCRATRRWWQQPASSRRESIPPPLRSSQTAVALRCCGCRGFSSSPRSAVMS